jgi:adenylosuccinate lyase
LKSEAEKRHFREILIEDKTTRGKLSVREIDEALNPINYLGNTVRQVELAVQRTRKERNKRTLK